MKHITNEADNISHEAKHLSNSNIYTYKYAVLFHSRFLLPLSLFYTNHLVPIIVFNYDYLNSMKILLCLCFYSLYYHFVNLNFIDNYNNLNIRLYAFWARGSRFKRRIDV